MYVDPEDARSHIPQPGRGGCRKLGCRYKTASVISMSVDVMEWNGKSEMGEVSWGPRWLVTKIEPLSRFVIPSAPWVPLNFVD
jgi:hypothetical protein